MHSSKIIHTLFDFATAIQREQPGLQYNVDSALDSHELLTEVWRWQRKGIFVLAEVQPYLGKYSKLNEQLRHCQVAYGGNSSTMDITLEVLINSRPEQTLPLPMPVLGSLAASFCCAKQYQTAVDLLLKYFVDCNGIIVNFRKLSPSTRTRLMAEIVRSFSALGRDEEAIACGQGVIQSILASDPPSPISEAYCRMAVADVYIQKGDYEWAEKELKLVMDLWSISNKLKALTALRLSRVKRRRTERLDISVIGQGGILVNTMTRLESLDRVMKLERLSELIAVLTRLREYKKELRFSSLALLVWHRLSNDESVAGDWKLGVLQHFLFPTLPEHSQWAQDFTSVPSLAVSMDERSLWLTHEFYNWAAELKLSGLTGPMFDMQASFFPQDAVKEFWKVPSHESCLLQILSAYLIPPDVARVMIRWTCPKILCILLSIGRMGLFQAISPHAGFRDHQLPLEKMPKLSLLTRQTSGRGFTKNNGNSALSR